MIPLPGMPKEVYQRDILEIDYEGEVTLAIICKLSKDEAMSNLIKIRSHREGFMRKYGFTDDEIKEVFKAAADIQKEYLAEIGITAEELY